MIEFQPRVAELSGCVIIVTLIKRINNKNVQVMAITAI
jgi:hypothetical protein